MYIILIYINLEKKQNKQRLLFYKLYYFSAVI